MARLGRTGDPHTVTRATTALAAAGWLTVDRVHSAGRTHNTYRPLRMAMLDDGRRYVELPVIALDAVSAGIIGPEHLRSLACWLDAAGREGRTRDSLAEHAARYGADVRTAKRHRSTLVAVGLLEVRQEAGKRTSTAAPGRLPPPPQTGDTDGRSPGTRMADHRGHGWQTEVPPVEVPPVEVPVSGSARRAPTASNVRGAATSTPPAPKPERSTRHPHTDAVVAQLPDTMRRIPDHYRRGIIRRIDQALTAGYGPAAILRAANITAGTGVPALRAALAALSADTLTGACRTCGQHPDDGPSRHLCDACHPDQHTLTEAQLATIAALRNRLGAPE